MAIQTILGGQANGNGPIMTIFGGQDQDSSNSGNIEKVKDIASGISTISSEMGANAAAQSGYAATTGALGASTAAGSAAASGAAGVGTGAVAGGATGSTIAKQGLAALLFYGGESVSQIKSNKYHQVKVTGGSDGLKSSNEDKIFYKNVSIPRKNV
jgi:hypothetical protein